MPGKVWAGRVLPALGLLVALVGLGVSIYRSVGPDAEPAVSGTVPAGGVQLTGADFPAAVAEPGAEVGDRIPDFTLELADGSRVTAGELVARGQPTFLFFWATT